MHMSKLLLVCSIGLVSCHHPARQPSEQAYAVKEVHHPQRSWKRSGRPVGNLVMKLSIALKQGRFEELESELYDVSNPFHARYGQYLDAQQIHDLVKPSELTTRLVHEWLTEHDIPSHTLTYSSAGDWISFKAPLSKIETLLDTKYYTYEHEDGDSLVRTTSWSLPRYLHDHVSVVQPTNSFFRGQAMKSNAIPRKDRNTIMSHPLDAQYAVKSFKNSTVAEACNGTLVTPFCLATLYGMNGYEPQATDKNKIAFVNYLGESSNRSDASLFLQQFRPDAVGSANNFSVEIINGGVDQQTPDTPQQYKTSVGVEGNLDCQTILGLTYPTPLVVYSIGGAPPFVPDLQFPINTDEDYAEGLRYILNQTTIPQTISVSYGDDEQNVPETYAHDVCNLFAQLGARGTTVLFASGDSGVGKNGACFSNDGTNRTTFLPIFPASCPYVTTVGGTKGFDPEVVAHNDHNGAREYSSGGGFSNYFPRPAYQDAVVESYLARTNATAEFASFFNSSGRAYPDISAQGQAYAVVWSGQRISVDGTSASSPTAASVLSLVSDSLIAAGKPPLGFLNPWLYAVGHEGFRDVIEGSAIGCHVKGFEAVEGWDPVTGFRTPWFPALKELAGNASVVVRGT